MSSNASTYVHALEEAALRTGLDPRAFGQRLTSLAAEAPDAERALRNLQRIIEAGFSSSLLRDFEAHPVLLQVCFELVGQSQYLADIIVRDPEMLRWLTASDVLTKDRSAAELEGEARQTMGLFERSERRLDALRRFHRREMLRIGAREILREASVETITRDLSALADVAARSVMDQAHADLNARLGSDLHHRMAVIALGKLGGNELNFSSDIDLLFVYDADGDLPRKAGRLHTWHEYHARLAEEILRGLSEFTSEGHLYRVDMRLRPDGRSGPLAMSRAAMMTYYEARGAAWERQMLLKARVIAGADSVGRKFMTDLEPFIFPRAALQAPWIEIARMKEMIEREADLEGNIKLGAGGIRDIEFLVQGLQLLFAGQDRSLRTGHTLLALERLVQAGHILPDDGRRLREAYMFFRSVEHRLQLLHGHQTHQLPETDEERTTLGRKLGFGDARRFMAAIRERRDLVRDHFEAFTRPHGATAKTAPSSDIVRNALTATDWPAALREMASQRLQILVNDDASRRLLEMALNHPRHRVWILQAAWLAPSVIERLHAEPLLLESLLGNADEVLQRRDPAWTDLRERDLHRYRSYNEVRTIIRFLLGATKAVEFEAELSRLAEDVLSSAADKAAIPVHGLGLFGLGKLGGKEMGIGSDLDLVLVYDEQRCDRSAAEAAGRAIARQFSTVPPLYRVDFRLRPEGRNAPLAVELGYLRTYLRDRAEPWEFLAMTRMRSVWGDTSVGVKVTRSLRAACMERPMVSAAYLTKMRRSMESQRVQKGSVDLKVSAGGIVDIEFVAQSLALRHPEILGRSTWRTISSASRKRWLTKDLASGLLSALERLRHMEFLVRLASPTVTSALPQDPAGLQSLAWAVGRSTEREFRRSLERCMKDVRAAFRTALRRHRRPSGRRR
ncbi:MAG: hypothetical protein MUE68_02050 [Bacteroidetes bacterium]|jgi:glutamate-ammonia-ligase adenylyltransferase|nr:hypothetical protein [Bacteroidota bacterium]